MTEAQIKAIIDENIRTNGREEITGAIANNILNAMVDYTTTVVTPTIDVSGAIAVGQTSTAVNGDKIARYLPTKSITKFDSNYAGLVGGYSQGNIVIHNDEIYVSEINNNLTTPVTSSITWRKLSSGGYTLPTASTTVLGGVKVDGSTIVINGSGVISAIGGGGGATYTAGNGINISGSNVISVKVDGTTITTNGSGQLVANAPESNTETIRVALSALDTNLVAGIDLNGFIALESFKIVDFKITAYPVPTGSVLITGIKKNGTVITTTNASIAPNQNNSTTTTQPVFSSDTFNVGDRLNFFIPTGGIGSVDTGQNLIATLKIEKL